MARHQNHARQFKYRVERPKGCDSREILKWLYSNFGQSSSMDLHTGVWFFDTAPEYPYKPFYFFKHERDAVYFRMTWE